MREIRMSGRNIILRFERGDKGCVAERCAIAPQICTGYLLPTHSSSRRDSKLLRDLRLPSAELGILTVIILNSRGRSTHLFL